MYKITKRNKKQKKTIKKIQNQNLKIYIGFLECTSIDLKEELGALVYGKKNKKKKI